MAHRTTDAADRSGSDLDRIAPLAEPARRRLYEVVARAGAPVDRDAAAAAAGVTRALAAFHLDRLVAAGLLEVTFRRRSGRTGPGAGRPAKFYLRPKGQDVSVQLPPRSYDVAAEILATGVERAGRARVAVLDVARERGRELGEQAVERGAHDLLPLLASQGYEPFEDTDGVVRLRNCPFHALVDDHRELTCAMNLALLDGEAVAVSDAGYRPVSDPREGLCCVAFMRVGEG
jgi:predicted ArsR family transcriptional regulator